MKKTEASIEANQSSGRGRATLLCWGLPLAAIGATLAGCSTGNTVSDDTSKTPETSSSAFPESTETRSQKPDPSRTLGSVVLTFESHGGSNVIKVYPGTTHFPHDRMYNGTYFDGDEVTVVCKEIGREVKYPEESPQWKSDMWFKLQIPDETNYGSAVFFEAGAALEAAKELPDC